MEQGACYDGSGMQGAMTTGGVSGAAPSLGLTLSPPSSLHPAPNPWLRRYGCEADPGAVAQYEAQLFPPFQVVLSEDVQEFHP